MPPVNYLPSVTGFFLVLSFWIFGCAQNNGDLDMRLVLHPESGDKEITTAQLTETKGIILKRLEKYGILKRNIKLVIVAPDIK